MNSHLSFLVALAGIAFTAIGHADKGVINDPDGFTNVRAKKSADSGIVAKVNAGEVFEFEQDPGTPETWLKVTLSSGKTGFMHSSRIRFKPTMADLADTTPEDEINVYGKRAGIKYFPLARAAAKGEAESMKRYFAINDTDGAAAEEHLATLNVVVHLIGDEKFAAFLKTQKPEFQVIVKENFIHEITLWPFEPMGYVKRNFPLTAKVLLK